jgi:hypothetical protein
MPATMRRGQRGGLPRLLEWALGGLLTCALLLVASLGRPVSAPPAASAKAVPCTTFASPFGSDAASGSRSAPFRTAQKLADSLSLGEAGCLRAGTYRGNVTLRRGGAPGRRATLKSYPAERARILGRLWITESADFVTISSLDLDGSTAPTCRPRPECAVLPSPTVYGDDVVFWGNDVTNAHRTSCFLLGHVTRGRAERTLIKRNSIHDCGRLPPTNHDHGIYVEAADQARIAENYIYGNADRGVQLYPNARWTYIVRNVIDGNGEGILFASRSTGNLAEHNLITNSKVRWNLESYRLTGKGNEARFNCLRASNTEPSYDGNGGIQPGMPVFTHDNVVANPLYVDRASRDYRLREGSPCAGKGPS